MTTYSLRKIISKISEIQNLLSLDEIRSASRSAQAFQNLREKVFQQISHLVGGIERDLSTRNLTGADLAIRSRRGYQWLKFLSHPDSLISHMDTLQRINLFLENHQGTSNQNYAVVLYHQGSLYKIRHQGSQREIVAQESFITAPDSVLKALLALARDPSSRGPRTIVREYTFTKEYQRLRRHLEYLGIPPGSFSAGNIHHLEESFQRVNQAYFDGKLPQPHLAWSRRLTHRKFGHYQWDTDTVMVSSTLDQERVPEMVVDFVVYHELLHKKLGTKQGRQNRIAHTREFRAAEERFNEIDQARKFLNRITQKRARSI